MSACNDRPLYFRMRRVPRNIITYPFVCIPTPLAYLCTYLAVRLVVSFIYVYYWCIVAFRYSSETPFIQLGFMDMKAFVCVYNIIYNTTTEGLIM